MKIAVCDWMILKRQKLGAFGLAQELGADGVEVDMGPLGERPTFENALAQPEVRERFLAEAKARKLEICSLAMSLRIVSSVRVASKFPSGYDAKTGCGGGGGGVLGSTLGKGTDAINSLIVCILPAVSITRS